MPSKILLGTLLLAAFAGSPTFAQRWVFYGCNQSAFAALSQCNSLRGPVHTAEMWSSYRNPDVQETATIHTILTYSRDGLLIEREFRRNGVVETREQYRKTGAGSTLVEDNDDVSDGQKRHSETVTYLNPRGELISREHKQNGVLASTEKSEFDGAGHKVSQLDCFDDGKRCSRTESQYDSQGNVTLVQQVELPSDRVTSRTEYEYPAGNRKRALEFESPCRDPDAPVSLPTHVMETTYDRAGRALEETTSSPVLKWQQENPSPGGVTFLPCADGPQSGRVVSRYDDHGRLLEQTTETHGFEGNTIESRSLRYAYDESGNETSLLETTTRLDCGKPDCHAQPEDARSEFTYKYDRFGNWTARMSYMLDKKGKRGAPSSIEYQKLSYY